MAISYYIQDLTSNTNLVDVHTKNNQLIYERIQLFQNENNLSSTDFIIGGSSCGSYMGYLVLKHVHDIDVFFLNDIDPSTVTRTARIDNSLTTCFCSDGYQDRAIMKDGYYFLAPLDVLVQETCAALIKIKYNNIEYIGRLLKYLNLTVDEFIPILKQELQNSSWVTEAQSKLFNERMLLLYEWHGALKKSEDDVVDVVESD